MNYKTLKKILLVFILCVIIKCLFPSTYVLADDLGEDIPEIEIEAEAIGKNTFSGGGQGFTIINDNLMANAIVNRAVFLVNKQNGQAYEESLVRRSDHCNTLTYDTEKQYLIAADGTGDLGADLYQVSDGVTKKITKVKHLNHAPGNGIGYDKVTGEFIGVGGHNIFAYKSENFYAGKSPYKTFRITYNSNYRTIQSAEAYGGNVYYVMTDGMDGRKIDGNTILVINIEQEKPIMRLHWSKAQEMEDCAFDSQGNLYFSTTSHYYKTNFNAHAEGLASTSIQPTNRREVLESVLTTIANSISDFMQILLECFETSEDPTKISLTVSSTEILTDESLQNDIQFESEENQDENQSNEDNSNLDTEDDENFNETSGLLSPKIKSVVTNKYGNEENVFSYNTPIPKISASFENFMPNKFAFFDLDFLNLNNQNQNEFWQYIRNFVVFVARITLFIAASLLITAIILRALLIIIFSLKQDAKKVASSKKILSNVIKATVLIIGVFVLIELIIYFYNFLVALIITNKAKKYIIKANVEGLYSFNTSFMGILKYMSLSSNIFEAFKWSMIRLICTAGNLALFYFMLRRTFTIVKLIIMAPFTAVTTMFEEKERKGILSDLNFKVYIKKFVRTVFYPLIFIIIMSLFI